MSRTLARLATSTFPWLKRRAELRERWGKAGDNLASGSAWYFDGIRSRLDAREVVDDKTWSDLELPRLFTAIDTTLTAVGAQVLFAWLRTFEYDATELDARYEACELLRSRQALRERIQLLLRPLELMPAAFIADLIVGPEPKRVPHAQLLVPWALLTLVSIVASVIHAIPVWACLVPVFINIGISAAIDARLGRNVGALMGLARLLKVARHAVKIPRTERVCYLDRLAAESGKRARLASQIKALANVELARSIEFLGGVVAVANVVFLLKLVLYSRAIERFARSREEWLSTFQLVGALDASVAVANFLNRYPERCRPRVSESELMMMNGYHPFISEPVKNSVRLAGRSALITGSNMTGKTTFIKMVAINVILGRTLGICLADQAILPHSGIRALIHGDQSVEAGKSRYFAEAEAIRTFIVEAASGTCRLFILDEPYSGTNTIERIAVAKAVLRAIGAHAQILVTTHDVELQGLLGDQFELLYFQENPAVEGFFDHRLHAGLSVQRNAIRVLERLGYPPDVIAEALATVPNLEGGTKPAP